MKIFCMPAPNRFRKMLPDNIPHDCRTSDKFEAWRLQRQNEIRIKTKEFPDNGIPLGLGYSFDCCDEVLLWSDVEYQFSLGENPNCLIIFNNKLFR